MTDAVLVDTNILLDVVTDDPVWADWSLRQLEAVALKGPLIVNGVVYAELSVRFERIEDIDAVLDEAGISVADIPRDALFLAGKAFRRYRASGGASGWSARCSRRIGRTGSTWPSTGWR